MNTHDKISATDLHATEVFEIYRRIAEGVPGWKRSPFLTTFANLFMQGDIADRRDLHDAAIKFIDNYGLHYQYFDEIGKLQ